MPENIIHKHISARQPEHVKGRAMFWEMAGFIASLLAVGGISFYLLSRQFVPWPFHGADTVAGTYFRVLVYLPFFVFSFLSVLWLQKSRTLIADLIAWRRFSLTVIPGILLSAGYSLHLHLSHEFAYKSISFIPPALILGMLNAVAEEFLFRLVFLQLLFSLTPSWQRANLMQAVVYGFIHLFIGGPVFFLGAVAYGLLLGWITKTNESILPAIICHFIADIGAIGLPLLIVV